MKTFCEVCTANPAVMVCCADDAVMCGSCDQSIHSANKVAEKHERVAFKGTSAKPNCDICQVQPVFVVCREDRAFLCRTCDLAIHSANEHVSKHERFLLTGVALELNTMSASSTVEEANELASAAENTSSSAPAAPAKSSTKAQTQNNDLTVPSHIDLQVPEMVAPKKTSSKRKAVTKQSSFSSQDYAVPDMHAPSAPLDSTAEFGDFVADLLAPPATKMQKVSSMSDFLEDLFDDDFPVDCLLDDSLVPDMANVPDHRRRI